LFQVWSDSPGDVFALLIQIKVLIERWQKEYNQVRPHNALEYQPKALEAILITMAMS
jgi:hypothetical protein